MKRLISESAVWKVAATGFGIISGIAIIAFMNQLNFLLHHVEYSGSEAPEKILIGSGVFLAGKIIAAIAGSFFCGAVIRLLYMVVELKYIVSASIVMMIVALMDLLSYPYPVWFQVISLGVYIPFTIIGAHVIRRIRTD